MSGSSDSVALFLVALAFSGFVVAAGSSSQTELTEQQLTVDSLNIDELVSEENNMTVERNAVWCFESDLSPAMLAACVVNQTFDIYVCVGYPNTSDYPSLAGVVGADQWGLQMSQTDVTNALALLASVDSRLKLWAWMGSYSWTDGHGVDAYVDFTSSAKRAALVAVMAEIAGWGFYGLHEDGEDYANKNTASVSQALVDYWNLLGTTLHSLDISFSTYTPVCWYNFNTVYLEKIVNVDYAVLLPRVDSQANWNNDVTQALANVVVPSMLAFGSGLIAKLGWFDALAPTGFVGFALYSWSDGGGISAAEWIAWNAWAPKTLTDPVVVVDPVIVTPTLSAPTLSASTIEVSLPITASASVTGTAGDGTGTLTFYASNNGGASWMQMGATKTLAAGAASSDEYYPPVAGNYIIMVSYSGDVNYNPTSSNRSSLTVTALVAVSFGLLNRILDQAEQVNIGDYPWQAGLWERGMWENNTLTRRNIGKMENH